MIFLALYPLLFWIIGYWQRRRWTGFLMAVFGPLPLLTWSMTMTPGYRLLPLSLALVFLVGGVFLAMQPRREPGVRCLKCDYLLAGNTSGRCPECGEPVAKPMNRARRLHPSAASPLRASPINTTSTTPAGGNRGEVSV